MLLPLALGVSAFVAHPGMPEDTQFLPSRQLWLAGRACPEILRRKPDGSVVYSQLKYSQRWAQVSVKSGNLNIRSSPGGRVISQIPKGWQVIVSKYDPTGKWAYIGFKYESRGPFAFGSAPNFRYTGWVAAEYLVPLGEACAKPMDMALLPFLQGVAQSEIRESLEDAILTWINPSSDA